MRSREKSSCLRFFGKSNTVTIISDAPEKHLKMNDFFHSRLDVFTIFLVSVYYVEGMYFVRKSIVSIYLAIAIPRKAVNGYRIRQ